MDIAKTIFETMDKLLYKAYNESVIIDGAEKITILNDKKYSQTKKFDCCMDLYFDKSVKTKGQSFFTFMVVGLLLEEKSLEKRLPHGMPQKVFL